MRHLHLILRVFMAMVLAFLIVFPASAAVFDTLRPGASGEPVASLQSGLQFLGFAITVDGSYGRQTTEVVTAFQRRYGLVADGLAGNRTLNQLYQLAPQFMPPAGGATVSTPPASPVDNPPPSGGLVATGQQAYVYTENRGSLNLRSKPSRGLTTIAQLPFGTAVTVFSVTGEWSQVQALGRTGYVISSYLRQAQADGAVPNPEPSTLPPAEVSPQLPPVTTQAAATGTALVITANRGSLNLRDRPASTARVLTQIPYAAAVQVLSRQGTWTQVSYRNLTGFVVDSFLTHQGGEPAQPTPQPSETPVQTTVPEPTGSGDGAGGVAFVNTQDGRTLNFRSAPQTGNNIIGQLPQGAALLVVKRGATFSEVIYQGRQGYAMNSFLRFEPQAPVEETAVPTASPDTSPSPSPDQGTAPLFPRVLRANDQGEDVSELQRRLVALKYTVSINGVYDAMTQEAVRHFQLQNALTADGVFGSQSARVLLSDAVRPADSPPLSYSTLRIDDRDPANGALSAMQQALKALGYPLEVNGRFDIPTHQAVVGFQQRNGLPITGIANPLMQSALFSPGAKGYGTAVAGLDAAVGKGGGPSGSQVKLLHWFNDIKPRLSGGQRVTVYHPSSDSSFTIRLYSLGNHADSEPATWQDTQVMNRAFGTPSWNINTVYVQLPDGQWTLAAMHNRPHLTGSVLENGFGGHLCIHFLRDMEEVLRNDPDYGASNQRAIRKAWLAMTGEVIE